MKLNIEILIVLVLIFCIDASISKLQAFDTAWCEVTSLRGASYDSFVKFNSTYESCVTCGNVTAVYNRSWLPAMSCCGGTLQRSENCHSSLEATCDTTRAIRETSLCDGIKDCLDGRDEALCTSCSGQERDKFRCSHFQCVELHQLCDGKKDCFNGLDETFCLYSYGFCAGFRCISEVIVSEVSYKIESCIEAKQVCDAKKDCLNGLDELNCVQFTQSGFQCSNTSTIPAQQVCDGTMQCDSKQDENNCYQWSQWGRWSQCKNDGVSNHTKSYKERKRKCVSPYTGYRQKCVGEQYNRWDVSCTVNHTVTTASTTTVVSTHRGLSNTIKAIISLSTLLGVIVILGGLYFIISTLRRQHYRRKYPLPHVEYAPSVELDSHVSEISNSQVQYRDSGANFRTSWFPQNSMKPSPSIVLVSAEREVVLNPLYHIEPKPNNSMSLLQPVIKRLSSASHDSQDIKQLNRLGKVDAQTDSLLMDVEDIEQFNGKLVIVQTDNSIKVLTKENVDK